MRKVSVKILQFVFLFTLISINLAAQTGNAFFLFKSYSTREGLSSYYSKKIAEDKYGFIWIATQDGLNRFDGKRFIQFNKNTPEKLAGNDVTDIIIDNENNLIWASTALGGLNAIDITTLRVKKEFLVNGIAANQPDDWITCMLLVKKELWVGTNNGLFIYNTEDNKITATLQLPASLKNTNARFNKIIKQSEHSIVALINNNAVVEYGTADKKILSSFQYSGTGNLINDIAYTGQDSILAATNAGLISLEIKRSAAERKMELSVNPMLRFISSQNIDCIHATDKTNIWLSSTEGLFRLNTSTNSITRIRNSSERGTSSFSWEGFINQLFFDSNNNLWLSTYHGIMISNGFNSPFTAYTTLNDETLKINHPFSIFSADSNKYLVNTNTGLIVCDKFFTKGIKTNPELSFYSGMEVNRSLIVFTSAGTRLYNGNQVVSPAGIFPELAPLVSKKIGSWLKVGDSIFLLAAYTGQEVWKWNFRNRSLSQITTEQDTFFKTQQVNSLYQDSPASALIVGVSNIYRYSFVTNSLLEITLSYKPPNTIFYDIVRKNGNYFIGTYGDGLLVYDSLFHFVKQVKTTNGLTNNNIYNFYDLGRNKLLAATNFGASVINTDDLSVRSYYEDDGMASSNFEYNFHPGNTGSSIFIPSINGLTMISPDHFIKKTSPPKIYFEKISIKTNAAITDTTNATIKKISIPANFLQVTIFFTGIDFSNPNRVQYFYRIPELTNQWINNEEKNFISLISMAPGTYHLQVKAMNEDGMESEIKELTLIFLPKWYQTWWFKTLIALSIIAIGYALYRMRITQFKKEQQIRSKIASDLHDDLGSTMNSVKVYANLAMMEKQADKYLPLIKDGTQDAITGIRDIIWVLDDSKDSVEDLLSRISSFAAPLCEAKNIKFKLELSDNARDHKLGQEERRNLYMMLKEAVNNAVKYSGCTIIDISVAVIKGKASIRIKDNGSGFDMLKTTDGNGLKNMQRRAKEIKYRAVIDTLPGGGTTIGFEKN